MSSDVIALSRIIYKKMMQNLVWATPYCLITIPAAAGPFVLLGNYSPNEHKCPRDKPIDCDRAGERALSTSFHFNVIDNGTATPLGAQYVQWVK
jgi:hypothetical protein